MFPVYRAESRAERPPFGDFIGRAPRNSVVRTIVNEHLYRPTAAVALILSADQLAAALLAAAVELCGCAVAFAEVNEQGRSAARRGRPAFLLLDARDSELCTVALLGPAKMTGTRTLLFGNDTAIAARELLVRELDLGAIV